MRIAQASIDENGKAHGGKAGDQNGKEVKISNWYSYGKTGWDVVIRPKDRTKAHKMAEAMKAACANDNIGYDQWQRESLLAEVKKVGNDFSKITTPTETDCSALVATVIVATGTPEEKMRNKGRNNKLAYTGDLKSLCAASGEFTILTEKKYLTSGDYLLEGDIILNEKNHVVIAIENGSKANENTPAPTPTLTVRDLKKGCQGDDVKELQRNLNTVLGTNLTIDGDFGKNTNNALLAFQKKYGLKQDGVYGPKSRAAMANALSTAKTTPTPAPAPVQSIGYKVKVTARNGLNVRKGPGSNYPTVRSPLPFDYIITVLEETNGWGKIGTEQYISLKYTTKI